MAIAALTPDALDEILKSTLTGMAGELTHCSWYVRERNVINLFVFGYLVPAFQARGLDDLTLIGIEAPVFQVQRGAKGRHGAYKDLVIWREPRTSFFKGCQVTYPLEYSHLHKQGSKPLAVLEWKNISPILSKAGHAAVRRGHRYDIQWLRDNLRANMFDVGYAILVDQTGIPTMTCRRLTATSKEDSEDFLRLPMAAGATA